MEMSALRFMRNGETNQMRPSSCKLLFLITLLIFIQYCNIPVEPCIIYNSFSLDKVSPAEVFLVLTEEDELSNQIRSYRIDWELFMLIKKSGPLDWIKDNYYNESGDLIIEWSSKARMFFMRNIRIQVWKRICVERKPNENH